MKRKTTQVKVNRPLPADFIAIAQRPRIGSVLRPVGPPRLPQCPSHLTAAARWDYAQGGLFTGGVLTVIGSAWVCRARGFSGPFGTLWTMLGGVGGAVAAVAVLWMSLTASAFPRVGAERG